MAGGVGLSGQGGAFRGVALSTQPQAAVLEQTAPVPFVIGILADFAGCSTAAGALTTRRFQAVDVDSLDARLQALQPRATFRLPNLLAGQGDWLVDLHFHCLADFAPASVAGRLAPLAGLLVFRQHLAARAAPEAAAATAQVLQALSRDPQWAAVAQAAQAAVAGVATGQVPAAPAAAAPTSATDDFARLMGGPVGASPGGNGQDPAGDHAAALAHLLHTALPAGSVASDADLARRAAVVAALDAALSAQLSLLLQHADFRTLEQAWLGVQQVLQQGGDGSAVQVVMLHLPQAEILTLAQASLGQPPGASWLVTAVQAASQRLGGAPVRCLVGDYAFTHDLADVAALVHLSQIASSTGSTLIAAAQPQLLGLASWQELAGGARPAPDTTSNDYAAWRLLRGLDEAAHLALAVPATLSRLPYGPACNPVEEFNLIETVDPTTATGYAWGHACYLLARAIATVVAEDPEGDWQAALAAGVTLDELPCMAVPARPPDDEARLVGPLAVALSRQQVQACQQLGLLPLQQSLTSTFVRLTGWQPVGGASAASA